MLIMLLLMIALALVILSAIPRIGMPLWPAVLVLVLVELIALLPR
jgi:hypothetical protein